MERQETHLDLAGVVLPATVTVPADPVGVVLFAHGSGSSRHSPRNRQVADGLAEVRLATVLFDLLTDQESGDRANVFDIGLLAERVALAVDWSTGHPDLTDLPVGVFGASTGAAAALDAAAARPDDVRAVVSRGGRPDLATSRGDVRCPVLLIVGSEDVAVIGMNQEAATDLEAEHSLELVEGAGHLFEGPGQLEEVTELAGRWFRRHLAG